MAVYDSIGATYDATRKADRAIVATFATMLGIESDGRYVDVACGTGNYTAALATIGGHWTAFDQSETMLAAARPKSGAVRWLRCDVEATGLEPGYFDGATCSLAIHHFTDLERAFCEVARILRPAGRLVVFTSTPEQMAGYWLADYFPVMMQRSREQMPSLETVRRAMTRGGLVIRSTTPYFVERGLEDLFLYCGKQRPELYLEPRVRDGISSFRKLCPAEELESGLALLRRDVASGRVREVIERRANSDGDYLFVVAEMR